MGWATVGLCLIWLGWAAYLLWRNRLKPRKQAIKRVARDVEDLDPFFLQRADTDLYASSVRQQADFNSLYQEAEYQLDGDL